MGIYEWLIVTMFAIVMALIVFGPDIPGVAERRLAELEQCHDAPGCTLNPRQYRLMLKLREQVEKTP